MLEISNYSVDHWSDSIIGRGAFGILYKGRDKEQNPVIVKKLSRNGYISRVAITLHYLSQRIHHRNIVRVHDVQNSGDSMFIVMEYCDFLDLDSFVLNQAHVLINIAYKVGLMEQITNGLAYLHENNIIHRDIKPTNILVKCGSDGYAVVKLCDFDLSKILDPEYVTSEMSSNNGTPIFKAPEFYQRNIDGRVSYHRSVDVYSAGLTFLAMLNAEAEKRLIPQLPENEYQDEAEKYVPIGQLAYERRKNYRLDVKLVELKNSDSETLRLLKTVIQEMTRFDPHLRPSADSVKTQITNISQPGDGVKNLHIVRPPGPETSTGEYLIFDYTVDMMDELGSGSFGSVYKGIRNSDQKEVVMKKLRKELKESVSGELVESFMQSAINHPNIIKIYDVLKYKGFTCIFMEYCNQEDLDDFFISNSNLLAGKFSWNSLHHRLALNVVTALDFLHRQHIVHRDIKPGNILVQKTCAFGDDEELIDTFEAKIGDFGLSKKLDSENPVMKSNCGTKVFMAPEFFNRSPGRPLLYDCKVDVWAAGLSILAMFQANPGESLVPRADFPTNQIDTIGSVAFQRQEDITITLPTKEGDSTEYTAMLMELIQEMTRTDPRVRISARDALDILDK